MENESSVTERLTRGLGWFSIALGTAEVIMPGVVAGIAGASNRSKTRSTLRFYGMREIAAGVGILTQPRPVGWLWARVAGDALDLASLFTARVKGPGRRALATASVIGVTAADIYCALQLSSGEEAPQQGKRANANEATKVVRTLIVNRPIEEAYGFWHDFEKLPQFMTYLKSVRYTGEKRTRWVADGPAGAEIAWDAEIVEDEPNRAIAWRSVEGSSFRNSGSVRFESAPGGRGTLVRAEVDYSGNTGAAMLGKVLKMDVGRRILHDLRNFKQMLEIGEVTQSDASVHKGLHAAQPEPVLQH